MRWDIIIPLAVAALLSRWAFNECNRVIANDTPLESEMNDRDMLGSVIIFLAVAISVAIAMPAIGDFLTRVDEANAIQRAAQ